MEIRKTVISTETIIVLVLVTFGLFMRLIPHVPNFAPIGAIALLGGALLGRRAALSLPLIIMIVSDLIIGFYQGIYFTWAAFLCVAAFGFLFRESTYASRVILGGMGGAIVFFIVSNFGTWIAGGMYPLTLAGLEACYVAAIPFFKTTLLADVVFSAVLFGAYELAVWGAKLQQQKHLKSAL